MSQNTHSFQIASLRNKKLNSVRIHQMPKTMPKRNKHLSDKQIVEWIKEGKDYLAFKDINRKYQPEIKNGIIFLLKKFNFPASDYEDVYSESAATFWVKAKGEEYVPQPNALMKSYILKIAQRIIQNRSKARKKNRRFSEELPHNLSIIDESIFFSEENDPWIVSLEECLKEYENEDHKEAFHLHYENGVPYDELAEMLGYASKGVIGQILSRMRNRIRKCILNKLK